MEKEKECIESLRMGLKGSRAERENVSQKYKVGAKSVKTKKKIDPKLKNQLLKYYGYMINDNWVFLVVCSKAFKSGLSTECYAR